MKRKNLNRNALVTSVISLLLCVSMLVGTTFAWFTDEVVTGMNTIAAGNLDVELLAGGQKVNSDTKLFSKVEKWEPGVVVYENLQVTNVGTLALQYQLSLNFGNENDLAGHKLSEVLKVAVIDKIENATRQQVLAAAEGKGIALADLLISGELEAGKSSTEQAVVIFWAPNDNATDNLYNANNHKETSDKQPLHIDFGVKLFASQNTVESDSFDNQYDKPAVVPEGAVLVKNEAELLVALTGDQPIFVAESFGITGTVNIPADAVITGNGATISRAAGFTGTMFNVGAGAELTMSNLKVDGGASWSGEVNPYLQRGTVNSGMTATGPLINVQANGAVILNENAILQNNDGANAVFLETRTGGTLTLNGAQIINNHSSAGAIWGGGAITINEGSKVNGNHGGIGGAIRVVTNVGTVLTMNGGEMNHNMSDDVGGAIWAGSSSSNNVYVFNGGEMAYNYSPIAGGAMYAGYYETVKIGGDFKMHDNSAPTAGAIRFHNHASFVMTGGEIYDNGDNALFLLNNSATITGGTISDKFAYGGGLGLTVGNANIEEEIAYNLSTNHNTAYLAAEFGTIKFTVAEGANFGNFNFKPATGYTYTDGDEAKLVCMNEGYETYWDAATSTFRLQAK